MSSTGAFGAIDDRRAGGLWGACARAAVLCLAWLPALGLVAVLVPQFEDLFSRLRENAELPAVTERLVWFADLNGALYFIPFVLMFAMLMFTDLGVAMLLSRSARRWVYWLWFGGVVVAGVAVAACVAFALMLPVLKMSASI
ncbi:MAG: hypothetical protein J5I93_13020 [Pirellulaceae bacterium]|nr:hypothetical protein [Pirellulaceae bacterium]